MIRQQQIRMESDVRSWMQSNEFIFVRRHIDGALGNEVALEPGADKPEAVGDMIVSLIRGHLKEYVKAKREKR